MLHDTEGFRPARLWKRMPESARRQAAAAIWADEDAAEQRIEAVATIARQMKFRAKTVQALPDDRKTRYLAAIGNVSDALAARLLISYHLAHQVPMMSAFLEALGIANQNGVITEEEVQAPAADRLGTAARSLAGTYPLPDVRLYFATLVWQDPETWGGLVEIIEHLGDEASRDSWLAGAQMEGRNV
jgi:hypothetical protein